MKKDWSFSGKLATIFVVITGCAMAPLLATEVNSQIAEQHAAAIRSRNTAQSDYINGLTEAIQKEKRNSGWADRKETELSKSYQAQVSVPRDGLKSVECRSSKCSLVVQLNDESPQGSIEQQDAIAQWISNAQSCAYTISSGPGIVSTAPALRIFLDCR